MNVRPDAEPWVKPWLRTVHDADQRRRKVLINQSTKWSNQARASAILTDCPAAAAAATIPTSCSLLLLLLLPLFWLLCCSDYSTAADPTVPLSYCFASAVSTDCRCRCYSHCFDCSAVAVPTDYYWLFCFAVQPTAAAAILIVPFYCSGRSVLLFYCCCLN